jgi:hypothetical protein
MNVTAFKEWIVAVSASVSMLSVAVGVWLSLAEYRMKLRDEHRQELSADVEREIRLQTLFTELMQIANGRSGHQVSEKAVEFVLANVGDLVTEGGKIDLSTLNSAVRELAVVDLPVGSAAQDAAIAAIASLTERHPMLREAGLRALESLKYPTTSPVVEHYHRQVTEFLKREGIETQSMPTR